MQLLSLPDGLLVWTHELGYSEQRENKGSSGLAARWTLGKGSMGLAICLGRKFKSSSILIRVVPVVRLGLRSTANDKITLFRSKKSLVKKSSLIYIKLIYRGNINIC
jgi:hypothetical protein